MERLVTAMDEPQRHPPAWKPTLCLLRSSLLTRHPLSQDACAFTSHLCRVLQDQGSTGAAAVAVPVLGVKGARGPV